MLVKDPEVVNFVCPGHQSLFRLYDSNEVAGWAELKLTAPRGQLYSFRATADSMWNTGYETEGIVLGGWGSVSLSQFFTSRDEIRLLLTRRERWIFNIPGVILTLITHWLGPPLCLPWCSKTTLAIWSERLAKDPYQKNTLSSVRLKPAILRRQIQAFYQMSYPAPD